MENHVTSQEMTPKQFLLQVPIPAQTSTYKPVSYRTLIDLTLAAIASCGFELEKEVYTHRKDGMRANGKYLLRFGSDPDMSLMIAWQNSYDKSLSLKIAIGTWVFVCENGNVAGDFGAFKSKHVGDIQEVTPEKLKTFICNAGDTFYEMVQEKDLLKEIDLTDRERAELLGRLFIQHDMITSTQLNVIKRELNNPTHDYRAPGTAWELYNYVTFAIKDANPRYWLQSQQDLHGFFMKEFNIVRDDDTTGLSETNS